MAQLRRSQSGSNVAITDCLHWGDQWRYVRGTGSQRHDSARSGRDEQRREPKGDLATLAPRFASGVHGARDSIPDFWPLQSQYARYPNHARIDHFGDGARTEEAPDEIQHADGGHIESRRGETSTALVGIGERKHRWRLGQPDVQRAVLPDDVVHECEELASVLRPAPRRQCESTAAAQYASRAAQSALEVGKVRDSERTRHGVEGGFLIREILG